MAEGDGYRFGDITRFLAKKATKDIKKVTGKERYEFGDLTRWADQAARQKLYNFTDKETYEFGDLSREVVRRIQAGEIETKDVFLALKILVTAGVSLTPIVSILPARWLIEIINLGLAQDVAGRLMEVVAQALDGRMKEAITGDANYQLDHVTKK
jgi:hypothetical protein